MTFLLYVGLTDRCYGLCRPSFVQFLRFFDIKSGSFFLYMLLVLQMRVNPLPFLPQGCLLGSMVWLVALL